MKGEMMPFINEVYMVIADYMAIKTIIFLINWFSFFWNALYDPFWIVVFW